MKQLFHLLAGIAVVFGVLWVSSVEPGAVHNAAPGVVDPLLARSIPGLLVLGVVTIAVVLWVGPRPDGSSGMGRGTAAMFVVLLLVSIFLLSGLVRGQDGGIIAALWSATAP